VAVIASSEGLDSCSVHSISLSRFKRTNVFVQSQKWPLGGTDSIHRTPFVAGARRSIETRGKFLYWSTSSLQDVRSSCTTGLIDDHPRRSIETRGKFLYWSTSSLQDVRSSCTTGLIDDHPKGLSISSDLQTGLNFVSASLSSTRESSPILGFFSTFHTMVLMFCCYDVMLLLRRIVKFIYSGMKLNV
jgi:hypothetical protein